MAYLFGDANNASAGKMSGMMAMNRCPSIAEAIEIANGAVSETDRGASNVNVVSNPDFETNTSGYDAINATLTRNTTSPISGTADAKTTFPASSGSRGIRWLEKTDWHLMGGRRVRVSFDYYVSDPLLLIDLVLWTFSGSYGKSIAADLNATTATRASFEFVIPGSLNSSSRLCWVRNVGDTTGGDLFVDNVEVEDLGITVDLPPSSLQLAPGQWLDESGNGGHPVLPDGMRMGEAKTEGVLFAENEFTASAVGQPICADLPVLPADCQLTLMMKASVSGDFNIGDGADPDRYAAGVTIGTDWAPVSQLQHTHDSTNRKIVVTPTMSYSGVVSTSVRVGKLFSG
jgi:hypothetical protein